MNFDYDYDTHCKGYYHEAVVPTELHSKDTSCHEVTFIYLDMPQFYKTEHQLETLFDKWLFALSHLPRMFERPAALHESVFDRLFEATEMAHLNSELLYAYERSVRDYRDWKSMIETARRRGREEARAEARKKVLEEMREKIREKMIEEASIGKKEMIFEMLRDGMPGDRVSRYHHMTVEEMRAFLESPQE